MTVNERSIRVSWGSASQRTHLPIQASTSHSSSRVVKRRNALSLNVQTNVRTQMCVLAHFCIPLPVSWEGWVDQRTRSEKVQAASSTVLRHVHSSHSRPTAPQTLSNVTTYQSLYHIPKPFICFKQALGEHRVFNTTPVYTPLPCAPHAPNVLSAYMHMLMCTVDATSTMGMDTGTGASACGYPHSSGSPCDTKNYKYGHT